MNIQLVPHTHIDIVWPVVGPMLERVCSEKASNGEYTVDQIRMAIVEKQRHLFIGVEDDKIIGAATISFLQYPQKRVALISALAGKGVVGVEALETIKQWCREMGATEICAHTKVAQSRLFQRVGFGKIYDVLGVAL